MKLALVTCYRQPDYVRGVTLREAAARLPNAEVYIIKNQHKGLLRYPEVFGKLMWLRLRHRPDIYLLTFRAYEILPFAAILTWPKKLMYDEFVNPLEWLHEERKELWAKFIPKTLLFWFYKLLLLRCSAVLADTPEHAESSQRMMRAPDIIFESLPVGTEEALFYPAQEKKSKSFSVFYYGSMLPLHGLDVVLDTAIQLKDTDIEFVLSGGDKQTLNAVRAAQASGANIKHHMWIPYNKLRAYAQHSHLSLGGPFGDTTQASMVVTGKTYQFLACGVPVLIGQTRSTGKFIDKQNCLSVSLGDSKALAAKLKWAANHPKELSEIAAAGRQLYEENYSYNELSRQLLSVLQRID